MSVNLFKRKYKSLIAQDGTVDYLVNSEISAEYSEYKAITKKVRSNIIVSHDKENNTEIDNNNFGKIGKDYSNPRVLPTESEIKHKIFGKDEMVFFFIDADYDVDKRNQCLCINIYGLTDDNWTENVSKEEKEIKSYNCPMMTRIWGFEPYLYIFEQPGWSLNFIDYFIQLLNDILIDKYPFSQKDIDDFSAAWGFNGWVPRYEIEECGEFIGYHGDKTQKFIKIFVKHPKMVIAIRNILDFPGGRVILKSQHYKRFNDDEDEEDDELSTFKNEAETIGLRNIFQENYPDEILSFKFTPSQEDLKNMTEDQENFLINDPKHIYYPKLDLEKDKDFKTFRIFEADIDFITRFIADNQFKPGSWFKVNKSDIIPIFDNDIKYSKNPIEFIVADYNNLKEIQDEDLQKNLPNFVKLSFDDEMSTPVGRFPIAEKDPIVAKGVSINVDRKRNDIQNYVFSVGKISHVKSHDFLCFEFENEIDMIKAWIEFIKTIDPDIIMHYNGNCFDWKYNIQRCKILNIYGINQITRHKHRTIYRTERKNRGLTKGVCKIPGIVNVDLLPFLQKKEKYPDYTLGYVSQQILGQTKEEFNVHLINTLQKTEKGREKLSVYVVKDSILPLKMYDKLNISGVQIARLARITPQNCFDRAQGAKIEGKLRQECFSVNGIRMLKICTRSSHKGKTEDEKYGGGAVLEPKSGFYRGYVLIEDFKGMYPSIIIAFNLCYTTYVNNETIIKLGLIEGEDYQRLPIFKYHEDWIEILPDPEKKMPAFVTRKIKEGILPRIERELGQDRDRIKLEMKQYPFGSFIYNLLDGAQLADKEWMNSIYGLSGDTTSTYFLIWIAMSITAYGRWMLHSIRIECKHYFNKKTVKWSDELKDYGKQPKIGYPFDADIIYGDTDSIFVDLANIEEEYKTSAFADEIGIIIGKHMNKIVFPHLSPIELEYEKKYINLNLGKKKNYAGYLLLPGLQIGDKNTYLDVKGQKFKKRGPSAFAKVSL